MVRNYFKIAIRNILKFRLYSCINIIGLAVGIACCIAIMLFIRDELSYDGYNEHADQVYRPVFFATFNGREIRSAMSPAPMGAAISHDLPEVAAYARMHYEGSCVIRYQNKTFVEQKFLWADSTLFDLFTLPFVAGDPKTALTQPNTVVITESTARKYFGGDNPIGQILNRDKQTEYTVTGVIKDVPQNSHFHPDFIGSLTTLQDSRDPNWLSNNYFTYFLLKKGTNPKEFEHKINKELAAHAGPQLRAVTGVSLEQFLSAGNKVGYVLQPLTSIHLNSHLQYELEQNGNISTVYIFSAIAVAILLIACINFVNLATARSEKRAKEVGIRKALGSPRSHLVWQFMAESILMSGAAVILAVGIVELLLPLFNGTADKKLSLNLLSDPWSVPLLAGFAIVVGVIAGTYPALYLSSFRPVEVLKSEKRRGGRESFLRNGLVVFQFAVSIVLFIGTLVSYNQLKYVQTRDLGFDREECVVISRTEDLSSRIQSFEHELRENQDIVSVSNSSAVPGRQWGDSGFWLEGTGADKLVDLQTMSSDLDFAKTYRLQMAGGRFFSKEHPSDTAAVVVNEEVARLFGMKDIVGKCLVLPLGNAGNTRAETKKLEVVGVVKDFNYHSLHEPIRPLVIGLMPDTSAGSFVTLRLAPGNHLNTISFIEKVWKEYAGNEEFNFNSLDNSLQELYTADQRTSKIAGAFSILAIFIACLGLMGLAAFITERRTKEIGIRKVLGATVPEVIALLTAQFAKWVLIANVIAWPLAYFIMNKWLQNFAYRTEMSLWIFVASGVMALIIALLTVSAHAVKAATANPVESLRYE
ncbi:MAG: ABC transporter permease [Bacteroidota bacterium]|nr:ABC transporter permease [Bacteroidota bacterium]